MLFGSHSDVSRTFYSSAKNVPRSRLELSADWNPIGFLPRRHGTNTARTVSSSQPVPRRTYCESQVPWCACADVEQQKFWTLAPSWFRDDELPTVSDVLNCVDLTQPTRCAQDNSTAGLTCTGRESRSTCSLAFPTTATAAGATRNPPSLELLTTRYSFPYRTFASDRTGFALAHPTPNLHTLAGPPRTRSAARTCTHLSSLVDAGSGRKMMSL